MSSGNDQLRAELERKFQPPIDVLLDPSLIIANVSLERLSDSDIFDSQRQATLGRTPTEPRIGDLYTPATFVELIETEEQLDVQKTTAWNFYRGQADGAFQDDIVDLLERNDVGEFAAETTPSELQWENALDEPTRQQRLLDILSEEFAFLEAGGVVLSRTPAFLETLRDAGAATIELGKAELQSGMQETLTSLGYRSPASICAFGVSSAGTTVDALVGDLLSAHSDVLLYRLGT